MQSAAVRMWMPIFIVLAVALSACAHGGGSFADAPRSGAKYVAMGSSFAAGPGVTTSADSPPNRCTRSADNYAHQLARRRGLALTDVSCGGATTAHLLTPWSELPAQLDAVDQETLLVTVTIGGNDVGYIASLIRGSMCAQANADAGAGVADLCPTLPRASQQAFADLESHMMQIAAEVRRRAPSARLVFVDYPPVLPTEGVCALTPLSGSQAEASRLIAQRVVEITARVARQVGADLLAASQLARGHDACAQDPWMNGYSVAGLSAAATPYHPNLAGMTAIADALERMIWR